MDERLDDGNFSDFESLISADKVFVDIIAELSDAMEWNERAAMAARFPGLFEESRAYQEIDITSAADKIHETFQKLCAEYSINPADLDISPELFDEIDNELAVAVYEMKKQPWAGDTLAAQQAIIVDVEAIDENEPGVDVVGISDGTRLVGEFVAPAVGPLPDTLFAVTGGEIDTAQISVGLIIENPRIVDTETGEVSREMFAGNRVIVALGVVGLELHKYVFIDQPEL